MNRFMRAAVFAAGFAAASAVAIPLLARAALAGEPSPSLQSFGVAKALSAYELSAPGMTNGGLESSFANSFNGNAVFASSTLLSSNLALDAGRGLDIGARFLNTGDSPFLSSASSPYLALANGGRYTGLTFVPADNLRLRAGVSVSSERLDQFSFGSTLPSGPLGLTYDASQSESLLGGLSWDVTSALGLDITGVSSQRSGVPLGFGDDAAIAPKASTQALSVDAHMDIGQGWVTTASFSDSLTQLDQRETTGAGALHEQS